MSRMTSIFEGRKAFIAFLTAGDPNLKITEELIPAMAKAGADMIEIGIPFSDPVAEGPVIQEADLRALASGTTTDQIFEMVRRVRAETEVPLAFMTYFNPIFAYGTERFVRLASECGVDALIIPDLPFEEKGEILPACRACGLELISMIAPTSRQRIQKIAAEAEGFLYCVSSMGVTGVRREITTDIGEMVKIAKSAKEIPCAVGFGISTPQQAGDMAKKADGVIVGSAIVSLIARFGKDSVEPVCRYVREMKDALSG